jgi:tetratricopeptide (TPR) repeat protein
VRPLKRFLIPALAIVAVLVFARTVGYDFVYDDIGVVRDRSLLHSLANWRAIIASTWWAHDLYRPFTALTLAANWSAAGGNPHAFHAVNVLLHSAVTVSVFLLACRLVGPGRGALAALLFAVHPVHVEAVANIVGRAEVLLALCSILAVLGYWMDGQLAAAGDRTSWRRGAASFGTLLAVVLALGSKESAFSLPGLLLLVDWWIGRERGEPALRQLRRHEVLWCGTVALAVIWLVARSWVVGDLSGREVAAGLEGLGPLGRAVAMLGVVPEYVRLLFVPARLSADYFPNFLGVGPGLTARGAAGALLLLGALAWGAAARRRAAVVPFALGWIAVTLAVVANLLAPTGILLAERTLYLPSVGAVLLVAWGIGGLHRARPRVAVALGGLLVAAGAARTVTRAEVWRSNEVFFPALIRDAPGSYQAIGAAAMIAYNAGDLEASDHLLRRAIAINPLRAGLWRDLGRVNETRGRWADAAEYFWAAFALDSTRSTDAAKAVTDFVRAGALERAAGALDVGRRKAPESHELMIAASDIALARGRPREAMTWRRQVTWILPHIWQYWYLTAEAAREAGDCQELRRSSDGLRKLQPSLAELGALDEAGRALGCGGTGSAAAIGAMRGEKGAPAGMHSVHR